MATNLEKANELRENRDFSIRTCWECNSGHEHMKADTGMNFCFACTRWSINGGFLDDAKHCSELYS